MVFVRAGFFAFALFFLVPVALALVSRMLAEEQFDAGFQMRYYNFLFFMLVVPLASLLHGSGVVRDALEQGTWHYHLLTPLRTWQTLIAKYLAAVSLVTLLTLPSLLATHLALYLGGSWGVFEHFAFTLRSAVACAFGAAAYCAVFSFMGVWVKRPLIIGVLYGLVSEFALQGLPGETVVRKFTVIFHVRSISTTDEMKTIIANSPLNSLGGFFNLGDARPGGFQPADLHRGLPGSCRCRRQPEAVRGPEGRLTRAERAASYRRKRQRAFLTLAAA